VSHPANPDKAGKWLSFFDDEYFEDLLLVCRYHWLLHSLLFASVWLLFHSCFCVIFLHYIMHYNVVSACIQCMALYYNVAICRL